MSRPQGGKQVAFELHDEGHDISVSQVPTMHAPSDLT